MLVRIVAAIGLVLLMTPRGSAAAPQQATIRLAGGEPGGPYHLLTTALADSLSGQQLAVESVTSGGSYANADLLRNGDAELALMQGDAAYVEYLDGRPFLALAALGTEPIHLLVLQELGVTDSSDLSRLPGGPVRIAIGGAGSGTSRNARAVLSELRPPAGGYETLQLSTEEAVRALASRQVDAAFLTAAAPVPQIVAAAQELRLDDAVDLIDLDSRTRHRLESRFPFLHDAEIPIDAYSMLDHRIRTLGTRTLLVARPDVDEATVERVLAALYDLAAAEPANLVTLRGFSPEAAMRDLSIPLLPAAERFHLERSSWNDGLVMHTRALVLLVVLAVALVLWIVYFARIAYFFERFRLGSLVAALVIVWLLGAEAMYQLEGGSNTHFGSFGRSALAILYYLFSGLESRYPYTHQGTALAVVILSLGVTVVAAITATIASRFVEVTLNVRTLRSKPFRRLKLRDHVVIAGWSPRTQRILRQLRSSDLRKPPTVVVITSDVDSTRVECRNDYRNVWAVEGDPSQRDTLLRADVDSARAALILTEQIDDASGDLQSIATTAAIEQLQRDVHTIVAIGHHRFREHLDYSLADEVVVHEALTEGLLSQCVINPGILTVYDELLSFGRGSQEIYFAPLPGWLAGRSFREAQTMLADQPLVVIGYCLGTDAPVLNPAPESPMPTPGEGPRRERPRLVFVADGAHALPRRQPAQVASPAATNGGPAHGAARVGDDRPFRVGICGCSSALPWLVAELCGNELWQGRLAEVLVIGDLDYVHRDELIVDERVRHVSGDPSNSQLLIDAGIERLDRLVVLSRVPAGTVMDEAATRRADHEAMITCQAARNAAPGIHLVTEVLDPRHREVFHHLAPIEIVSVADLSEKLLAQAVVNPGVTHAFLELLTATATSSEIYLTPVPPQSVGLSYASLARDVVASPDREIVLGYRSAVDGTRRTSLNPGPAARRYRLQADDQVIVLAAKPPRWG